VHEPAAYLTPDVVADISQATVEQLGADRVQLRGVRGHVRRASLKVNVCHENGWLAEGEISYAGPRAEPRSNLLDKPNPSSAHTSTHRSAAR